MSAHSVFYLTWVSNFRIELCSILSISIFKKIKIKLCSVLSISPLRQSIFFWPVCSCTFVINIFYNNVFWNILVVNIIQQKYCLKILKLFQFSCTIVQILVFTTQVTRSFWYTHFLICHQNFASYRHFRMFHWNLAWYITIQNLSI